MASNTKLDFEQKEILRDMRNEAGKLGVVIEHFPEVGVTIASLNKGNTARVATAIMSDDERKYRKKVGEYYALSRLLYEDRFIVVRADFDAYCMAQSIGKPDYV